MIKLLKRARRGGLWRLAGGAIVIGLVVEIFIVWAVMKSAPTSFWLVFVPVGGFFALLGAGVCFEGWRIWRRPLGHPRFAGIRGCDTEMHDVLQQLERDLPSAREFSLNLGKAELTDHCLVTKGLIIGLRHVIWMYPQETRHSFNHIPTGSTQDLALYTAPEGGHYDEALVLMLDDADALMSSIAERAPWAFVGAQPRWANRWNLMRDEIAERVRERRDNPPYR